MSNVYSSILNARLSKYLEAYVYVKNRMHLEREDHAFILTYLSGDLCEENVMIHYLIVLTLYLEFDGGVTYIPDSLMC